MVPSYLIRPWWIIIIFLKLLFYSCILIISTCYSFFLTYYSFLPTYYSNYSGIVMHLVIIAGSHPLNLQGLCLHCTSSRESGLLSAQGNATAVLRILHIYLCQQSVYNYKPYSLGLTVRIVSVIIWLLTGSIVVNCQSTIPIILGTNTCTVQVCQWSNTS